MGVVQLILCPSWEGMIQVFPSALHFSLQLTGRLLQEAEQAKLQIKAEQLPLHVSKVLPQFNTHPTPAIPG